MPKKVEIEMIDAGMRELLRSEGVEKKITDVTRNISAFLGEGYKPNVSNKKFNGAARPIGTVNITTQSAMDDNFSNNTLLKAIGG